jgi:hypothetical protein
MEALVVSAKERTMATRWSRRLAAGVLGIALLLGAQARAAAQGAGGTTLLQVQGELTDKDERDKPAPNCYCKVYPFQMQAGKKYQIDLKSKEFDAFLRLEDPSGKEVASDDDSGGGLDSRIIYTAPATGGYKIVASTYRDNETGKFTLTVVELGGAGAAGKALTFLKGLATVIDGQLTNADPTDDQGKHFKTFSFQAQAGNAYRFEMTGKDWLDPYVRIEDAGGKVVREEEFGDGKLSRVGFTAPQAGTFKVVVTTFKGGMAGGFTLTATEVVSGPATQITFKKGQSTTLQGNVANTDPTDGQGKHFKAFSFQAQAGATYRFEMAGQGGLDPYARIEDATGRVIREEEFGDGKVSRVSFTAPQAGTYKAIATTFKAGMTGGFTLTASEIGAESPPVAKVGTITLKPGQTTTIQGQLTSADPTDGQGKHFKAFSFPGQADRTYRFEMTGKDGLDAYVRVEDASGKSLREEEFGDGKVSRLSFVPGQAGTYKVIATTFKGGMTGGFTLTANEEGTAPPVAKDGQITFKNNQPSVLKGSLAGGDPKDGQGKHFKAFTFQAEAGKTYRFELTGQNGLDPFLRLEDGTGKQLRNEDFGDGKLSRITFSPTQPGTYKIIATTFKGGGTGDFTLTVIELRGTAVTTPDQPRREDFIRDPRRDP